jgi:hypothetical protein
VTGSGDLIVTQPYAIIERARSGVIVRCSCGSSKAFDGRRVVIDVPAA